MDKIRTADDFFGDYNLDALMEPPRLNDRLRTNFKYYAANYILLVLATVVINTILGTNPLVSLCFGVFLVIVHACLRPQTLASAGSVKVRDAKNKAKSMVDAAKAKAKSAKVN